jgi:hypothetical protein
MESCCGARAHNTSISSRYSMIVKNYSLRREVKPGTTTVNYLGTPFPTIVFEVSHTNETWQRLLSDGRTKAFSRNTTIQVLIAFKIYAKHFRAMWGIRGARWRLCRVTRKFPINRSTGLTFDIPTALIFWGCPTIPPHLQNTLISVCRWRSSVHNSPRCFSNKLPA